MFESLKTDYTIFTDCTESDHLCEYFNVNGIVFDFIPPTQDGVPLIDQLCYKSFGKKILCIISLHTIKTMAEQTSKYNNFFNLVENDRLKIIFYQNYDSVMSILPELNFRNQKKDDQFANILKDLKFIWWVDALIGQHLIKQLKNCQLYCLNFSGCIDKMQLYHHFNLIKEKEKTNTFFTLTLLRPRIDRIHRNILVEEIQDKPYLKNSINKINSIIEHKERDKLFTDLSPHYGSIFLKKAKFTESMPVISYYEKTYFELVTETLGSIEGDETFFPTEKILKPIMMRHPFVVLSTKHFLKNLRDFGFKTFGDFIDESYDDCDTVRERVKIISKNLERLDMVESKKFYEDSKEICQHNQNHLMYLAGRYKFDLWNKWNNFFKNFN